MIGKGFTVTDTKQMKKVTNRLVAEKLDEVADLLEQQEANLFRVAAYRGAAAYIAGLKISISQYLANGGPDALKDLPTIGHSIAASIIEILQTGHLRLLDSLRGDIDPEKLLQTVPQIGPVLAETIHEQLGVSTLEALEVAAHDGTLAALPGFGPRRMRGIQYALKDLLARRKPIDTAIVQATPPITETLDVDRDIVAALRKDRCP